MVPLPGEKTPAVSRTLPPDAEILNLVVDNVVDHAILVMDSAGRLTNWSLGTERLFGYSTDELAGESIRIIFTDEDRAAGVPEGEMSRAAESGRATDERWHRRKDGTLLWGSGVVTALRDDHGGLRGFVKILRDATEVKRLAEEHAHLVAEAGEARRAAETANRAKDEFLATISHELRQPLNSVLGWAHMIQQPDIDEPTFRKAAAVIVRNAQAQQRLIGDLLDTSRIVAGQLRLDVQELELIPVIQAAIETLQPAARAKEIHIERVLDPEAEPILGDPLRMEQVVWNLLSNAIKFTPTGGTVEVRLERAGRDVRIVVADTGRGISADLLPHVFDRFRQGPRDGGAKLGGLGLGLGIVKHIAELHGGTVEAHSAGENQGSTFVVSVPWWNPRDIDEGGPGADEQARRIDLHNMRVLLVEDESDTVELLRTMLERYQAHIRAVATAEQAMRAVAEFKPDVIVADILLGTTDGYDLIRSIRALPPESGGATPAIALTALARSEDHRKALDAGYQVHLPKPVTPAKLIAVLGFVERQRTPVS
jgi:PAS domain S-box-containing protein